MAACDCESAVYFKYTETDSKDTIADSDRRLKAYRCDGSKQAHYAKAQLKHANVIEQWVREGPPQEVVDNQRIPLHGNVVE